ncbi:prepilin-type cleavage/methylation domain-containing protein [Aphanothece hegewaldii CCALA 016]|uniref:Prepilin-type cleavage/methylation domain-containing protein n=1 Tax=Aphanothece hegewaldii CCALA 016 TaxID=2107694 RepID=A0A2T1M3L5_9CHRO|nr:prepilin-type N-terminal cleavage/methylation domain-containing protein [Aphanothece hegewaldii]PSF39434.1 prepilin-type cleavage/methylation domain-containing protein [Aphanothece hegewaldii CCALA 016]
MTASNKKVFYCTKLKQQPVYNFVLSINVNTGLTLLELMITLVLIGILITIAFSVMSRLMSWFRLNIATFQLSQQWKTTRYEATGKGSLPMSVCMAEILPEQIQYTQIQGSNCEVATQWLFLPQGVSIDTNNSTLPTVNGIAGNGGKYYRASWADTQGGMGGSWGQLGRIVLITPPISAKKCLFLFKVDGSWNIRENANCNK